MFGRTALAGQIVGKESGFLHAAIHAVAVAPRPLGKESRRFTEAVADDSSRVDPEALYQITDGATDRYLAENNGPMIVIDQGCCCIVPEQLRLELCPQQKVLFILAAQNSWPAVEQFHPHAGIMIAGTGKDKRYFPRRAKRFRCIKQPITQARQSGEGSAVILHCGPAEFDKQSQLNAIPGNHGNGTCFTGGCRKVWIPGGGQIIEAV